MRIRNSLPKNHLNHLNPKRSVSTSKFSRSPFQIDSATFLLASRTTWSYLVHWKLFKDNFNFIGFLRIFSFSLKYISLLIIPDIPHKFLFGARRLSSLKVAEAFQVSFSHLVMRIIFKVLLVTQRPSSRDSRPRKPLLPVELSTQAGNPQKCLPIQSLENSFKIMQNIIREHLKSY